MNAKSGSHRGRSPSPESFLQDLTAERTSQYLVVVTGLPAAGKTTVARALSQFLPLPALLGDSIKEAIFDMAGFSNRSWSQFLSKLAAEIAFRELPDLSPCIVDVFMPAQEALERFSTVGVPVIEVHCHLAYEIAWRRFTERANGGERHPGHIDEGVSFEYYRDSLVPQHVDEPLGIGRRTLMLDTSGELDVQSVVAWTRAAIRSVRDP